MERPRKTSLVLLVAAVALFAVAAGCASYRGSVGVAYSSHHAHPAWVYGSRFYLAGGSYHVLHRPYGYGAGYYFRTRHLGAHRRCGRYCFTRGGYHYHHASCGHLRGHVSRHGYRVDALVHRYGPR